MKKGTLDAKSLLKRFALLFGSVLLIGVEIIGVALFAPQLVRELLAQNDRLNQLTAEVAAQQEDLDFLSGAAGDSQKIASDYAKVAAALPDEKKVSGVITGITTLANQAGVRVDHLEFSPGTISTVAGQLAPVTETLSITHLPLGVEATPATLAVSGTRSQLTTFLSSLPKTSQLIGVEAVNLTPQNDTLWNGEITLRIYYQPAVAKEIVWGQLAPLTADQEAKISELGAEDIFVP